MIEHTVDTTVLVAAGADPLAAFPIVGVGASAGGLAATTDLLRNLGARPDVAVVIVHHLDPSHASGLVDIFSRVTTLPMQSASNGMRVERNHVYVVPPNAGLEIAGGKLNLTPRAETAGLHLPIDRFFKSLARDRTANAVGVVLTGTDSDGTLGVRAIKAEGGVNFAQDGSAEYRGMPDNAIETGCVDFILAPESIARELARMGGRWRSPSSDADDVQEFQRILLMLSRSSGIDFANYKHTTMKRRVQRRVVVNGLADLREYAELLGRSPEETRALSEDVLIHVTSFFRDPETFQTLTASVFPRLVASRPRDACIRVWVAGCSTGEEVYSIAISLLEFLADAPTGACPIKLFGTDVSLAAIDGARRGRYPPSIEHDVSAERLERFFLKQEGGYQIRPKVRDLCVFARQDATIDPPFAGIDLISCRNLMIYLGSPLQERLLPLFHYALKEPGFLVLGSAETIRSFPGFVILDAKSRVYVRTSAVPRLLLDFSARRDSAATPYEIAAGAKSSGPLDIQREADRLVLAEYAPPGVVITDDLAVVQFRGRTGSFLDPVPGTASLDLLRIVRQDLRLPLRRAIDEARTNQVATLRSVPAAASEPTASGTEIEVTPFGVASTSQRFFVVLFRETKASGPDAPAAGEIVTLTERMPAEAQAEQELVSTRNYLQSVLEQSESRSEELAAANEESVASNEELRSTNEELQMAKEELQATNEELNTVNDEMALRHADTARLSDDLTNVLSSIDMPIVLLGRDSRVRRFTPAAAKVFHLLASDIGRPISDFRPITSPAELAGMIADVLTRLNPVTRTVQDEDGRWRELRVRPYLTGDNRIDGTIITAIDVDAATRAGQIVEEARRYAESVIDTVRAALVVLDGDLRVRSSNRAFRGVFRMTDGEITGRDLDEIGRGEWNLGVVKQRLRDLGDDDTLDGYRMEVDAQDGGRRVYVLNARHIESSRSLLLAMEDVTDKENAEQAIQRMETGFREMLTTIAEAILMTDGTGRIVFANEMVAKMFGCSTDELVGLAADTLVPERVRERRSTNRSAATATAFSRRGGLGSELIGRRKDGAEFPIEVVVGSMNQQGGPLVMSFITDTTKRRESERVLRDYQDKLQRMAFDAALVEERERRRIAADLHDRIGQALALAQIKLTSARETISGAARIEVDGAVGLLAQSIIDTRTLIFELSPPILYDLGLKAALSWLVEDLEKRHGVQIELSDDDVEESLDEASAALVFRGVRELLMNVFKHAQTPRAKVSLRRTDACFEVEVEDEGVGFDPSDVSVASAVGGFGLFNVREQISRLGGSVEVTSAPQHGTRVSIRLPVNGKMREASKTVAREEAP